mmetsp:Transcript_7123/g.26676  ORF Transcript_7123/g.26676 Transcript_7123/m.26676 type:complete len:109 (+) Transcript_7123:3567-3893(+)
MDELDQYNPDTSHADSYKATDNPKNKVRLSGHTKPNKEKRLQTENMMQGSYEESNFANRRGRIVVPGQHKAYSQSPVYSPGSPPEKEKKQNLKHHQPEKKPQDDTALM